MNLDFNISFDLSFGSQITMNLNFDFANHSIQKILNLDKINIIFNYLINKYLYRKRKFIIKIFIRLKNLKFKGLRNLYTKKYLNYKIHQK